jgi:hypothetical protein
MGLFSTRKPRKFRRVSIYTDERRDKRDRLVRDVLREMGKLPTDEHTIEPDHFKGKFAKYIPRTQRNIDNGRSRLTWPVAIIVIIILIFIWHYLKTGNVHL